ncbi:MAG: hypothetical protein FD147_1346 [Chloroflexi bacterium]|nr:MAG: hypothetical protein FD147_1346 [Chloroflexota bacterium]MBA4376635.1 hypothetical protein [Anaerolinea sp.]
MDKKALLPWLYLGLGFTQAAHSVEEVMTGLWQNLLIATSFIHSRVDFVPMLEGVWGRVRGSKFDYCCPGFGVQSIPVSQPYLGMEAGEDHRGD